MPVRHVDLILGRGVGVDLVQLLPLVVVPVVPLHSSSLDNVCRRVVHSRLAVEEVSLGEYGDAVKLSAPWGLERTAGCATRLCRLKQVLRGPRRYLDGQVFVGIS